MRRIRRAAGWIGLFLVSAVSACAGKTEADTRFEENKSLFAAIKAADQLILYEGLPHQADESEQLAREKRNKETVALHGFSFYRAPLEISAEDKEKLKAVLSNEGSFRQWQGEKKCGGFHPDYCAEWRGGDAVYRFLICFGCSEVKVFGRDKSLRCDIRGETREPLEELLKKYRKNRP
jgi:hypothetical protein